jgi:hypothetical protein
MMLCGVLCRVEFAVSCYPLFFSSSEFSITFRIIAYSHIVLGTYFMVLSVYASRVVVNRCFKLVILTQLSPAPFRSLRAMRVDVEGSCGSYDRTFSSPNPRADSKGRVPLETLLRGCFVNVLATGFLRLASDLLCSRC